MDLTGAIDLVERLVKQGWSYSAGYSRVRGGYYAVIFRDIPDTTVKAPVKSVRKKRHVYSGSGATLTTALVMALHNYNTSNLEPLKPEDG